MLSCLHCTQCSKDRDIVYQDLGYCISAKPHSQEPSRVTDFGKCTLKSEVLFSVKTDIEALLGRIRNMFFCQYGAGKR